MPYLLWIISISSTTFSALRQRYPLPNMRTVLQKSHQKTHPRLVISGKRILPIRFRASSGRRWCAGKGRSSRFSMKGLSGLRVILPVLLR